MNATARTEARLAEPHEDLIIDLFAGGGGASEAILRTTGRHPDIAVNHDAEAIALHTANHPNTLHLCDDIRQVDIAAALAKFPGRRVGLLWASPDCKDHSKAKGGKPKDKNIRGLAWEVLRWSAAIRRATGYPPRVIALENVEEFADWGPIHTSGRRAGKVQKGRRGETFKLWVNQLKSLGARVDWRELVAARYGAPTTRKRLFLIARFDREPIVWPAPTHASPLEIAAGSSLLPWRTAANSVIDWTIRVPSIFGCKKELQPKTKARIAKGVKRYVIEAARPFLVKVTHTTSSDMAASSDAPLQTVTTAKGGEFAVAAPTLMPLTHGGAIDRSYSPEDPMRTVTGANRGEFALIAPSLVPRYGERPGQEPRTRSVEAPYPAVVPDGNGGSLAAVHLTKFSENGVGVAIDGPMHTAMAGAPRHGMVAAYLGRQFGTGIGSAADKPAPTVMADGGGKTQVVSAHLSRMGGGQVGGEAEEPLKTTATHAKDAVVTPFMAQHNGDRVGRQIEAPLTTTVHRGTQQQLVAPLIDKYYGAGVAADASEPLDTATAKARFGLGAAFLEQANTGMVGHDVRKPVSTVVGTGSTQRLVETVLAEAAEEGPRRAAVLRFLWDHFGEPTADEIAEPLASASGRLRFGLVVLDEVAWCIVDIGMRMLVPRELYRAQGFGDDYVIELEFKGKPLTKTAQTRMAGNSVSPDPAAALLRQNIPEAMLLRMAA